MADVISVPMPERLLSLNDRLHHMTRYRREQAWQHAVHWAAVKALGADRPRRARPPSLVEMRLPFKRAGRRDPHNYVATVKPIVDGLVLAGLWPDDTPAWVRTAEPELVVVENPSTVLIRITPLET